MSGPLRYLAQVVIYTLFCAVIYYLSTDPVYYYLQPDQAELKLAFQHAAQRKEKCRKRTREELMKLPPNMRRAKECSRARAPLTVKLLLDGDLLAEKTFNAPGLHDDGAAYVYTKFPLPAGEHQLSVRMIDSVREEGYDYAADRRVALKPGQALVVGFNHESKKFIFY